MPNSLKPYFKKNIRTILNNNIIIKKLKSDLL